MLDRKTIMKLVESGRLTAEQAEELLAQLEFADFLKAAGKVKALRIRMEEISTGNVVWEETVPVAMVKLGLKMSNKVWHDAVKKYPDLKDFNINFKEMQARLGKDEPGNVACLVSKDGTKKLHIWLE